MFFYLKGRLLNKNYKFEISVKIFRKIPIFKIEITKEKLEKLGIKEKIKNIDISKIKFKEISKKDREKLKKYGPKIEFINLYLDVGAEDAVVTSYTVVGISTILGIMLKKQLINSRKNKFIINPVYNKKLLNLEINCIFRINLIHIIYIIYILNKKRRDDKNVRTSNRRSYGYSYE